MALALMERASGYYSHAEPIGSHGDFTTAPEISQIFGELIGAFLAQSWLDMGAPTPVTLLELGPGRGTLLHDALRATRSVVGFHDALSLTLLEGGSAQRQRQASALSAYRSQFIDRLERCPTQAPLLVIGNEFLDALPIRQFLHYRGELFERLIDIDPAGALHFVADHRAVTLDRSDPLPEGAVIEIAPAREAFVGSLCELLKDCGGTALLIDYGDEELVHGDTLQAVRHHQKANPLENAGMQDLSSRVAFGPLRRCANRLGCQVYGPLPQGRWLERLGAFERLARLCNGADADTASMLRSGLQRLTAADAMGTLFKAMALTTAHQPPPGFLDGECHPSC